MSVPRRADDDVAAAAAVAAVAAEVPGSASSIASGPVCRRCRPVRPALRLGKSAKGGRPLKRLLVASLLSLAFLPAAAGAAVPVIPTATLSASATQLPGSGGLITVSAVVHGAQTCLFFSAPQIPGIDGKVPCSNGKVVRHGRVGRTNDRRPIQFELVATGANGLVSKGITIHQGVAPPPPPSPFLFQQSGSGTASTARFTIPSNASEWDLTWEYDCSGFGTSGNFIVDIKGSLQDLGVNQLGASGTGTEHYFDTGTFSLVINSECSWVVEVYTA